MQITTDTTKAETNSEFTRQQFGIADMNIVMSLLSKLYSKPIQTLVQEYICNGRDATREAKTKRPLEITLPTRFVPTFSVRDYGCGLDPERIKTVFLLYGASTKRDSNSQTGGFGIGAKSAWAYTDSFTIISYVNGTKRTYVAHKSGGGGNLDLVNTEATKEGNGTEIQIAVKPNDIQSFRQACQRAVIFWKASETPVLKGIAADEIEKLSNSFSFDDSFTLYPSLPVSVSEYGCRLILNIDGIPYTINNNVRDGGLYKLTQKVKGTIVANLSNGVVNIAPNREELIYDDRTTKVLNDTLNQIHNKVNGYVDSELKKCNKFSDLIVALKPLAVHFYISNQYCGYTIQNEVLRLKDDYRGDAWIPPLTHYFQDRKGRLHRDGTSSINLTDLDRIYFKDIEESQIKNGMRLRLQAEKYSRGAWVLNPEHADVKQMIIDLQAKPISALDLPIVQRTAKGAAVKLDFCIHWPNRGSEQTNLAKLTDKYIYDSFTLPMFNSTELHALAALASAKAFRIADSNLNYIKGKTNFQSAQEFIDSFSVPDSEVIKYCDVPFGSALTNLKKHAKDIVDLELSNIIEMLPAKYNGAYDLPEVIRNSKLNTLKFSKIDKISKSIDLKIRKLYPLFGHFNDYDLKEDAVALELITYMNYKHKLSKKVNKVKT